MKIYLLVKGTNFMWKAEKPVLLHMSKQQVNFLQYWLILANLYKNQNKQKDGAIAWMSDSAKLKKSY